MTTVSAPQHLFPLNGRIFFIVSRNQTQVTNGHLYMYEIDLNQQEIHYRWTLMNALPQSSQVGYSVVPYIGSNMQSSVDHCMK